MAIVRGGFVQTRVGRRYLLLFLAAAIVPVVVLAAVSFAQVRDELGRQAYLRVERMGKSVGLSALSSLTRASQAFRNLPVDSVGRTADDIFVTVARFDTSFGHPRSIDRRESARDFSDDELAHLRKGFPLLSAVTPERETRLYIGRAVDARDLSRGVYWARLNTAHLWETVDELVRGEQSQFCVFESLTRQRLRCASDMSPDQQHAAEQVAFSSGTDGGGAAEGVRETSDHLVGARDLYLRYEFGVPDWRIVVLEPRARVFDPLRRFTNTFVMTVALAIVLVFLLSYRTIRRSTVPLERLRAATRRIAAGDLDAVVTVDSDDEFGDLAVSFNGMAGALERQISLLRSLDAIDESVLGARDSSTSIDDAVSRLSAALRASRVSIARVTDQDTGTLEIACLHVREGARRTLQGVLSPSERDELLHSSREVLLQGGTDTRSYVPPPIVARGAAPTRRASGEQLLVLPLLHDHALVGVVTLSYDQEVASWSAERERARRLCDRVALALANVHLVHRLESLSTATLTAFARAIDANSAWTAGHSERVTRVALVVGRRLGLTIDELETLHRGGLLHDIGKIGVPPGILDKPGALTDEEWKLMKLHPTLGAQILSPLSVFADAIPIVLHHHERYDGTGYPMQLAGDAIPRLARVLAVADTFDALVSRRPYREGVPIEETMAYIRRGRGTQFDPLVADAMLAAYAAGEIVVASATSAQAELAQAMEQGRFRLGRVA